MSRDRRPSKVASVGRFLLQVPWAALLNSVHSCKDKLKILTEVFNYGLTLWCPSALSARAHKTDWPWLNNQLKQLIARRQKAFASGNLKLFKILRNKVNPERKRCHKAYYESKVKDMRDSKPRGWWREVKQLSGASQPTRRDLKSILYPALDCETDVLAERINQAFLDVMKDYSSLTGSEWTSTDGDHPIVANCCTQTVRDQLISCRRSWRSTELGAKRVRRYFGSSYCRHTQHLRILLWM